MSYLTFILVASITGFVLISLLGFILKRDVWRFSRSSLVAISVFYIFFWVGDAISIYFGYYVFDQQHLLGPWIGGIPLEDHIAGILGLVLVKCLFNFFEGASQEVNSVTKT